MLFDRADEDVDRRREGPQVFHRTKNFLQQRLTSRSGRCQQSYGRNRSTSSETKEPFAKAFHAGQRGIVIFRTFNEGKEIEKPSGKTATEQWTIDPQDGHGRGFAFVWRRFEIADLPAPLLACVMVTVPANELIRRSIKPLEQDRRMGGDRDALAVVAIRKADNAFFSISEAGLDWSHNLLWLTVHGDAEGARRSAQEMIDLCDRENLGDLWTPAEASHNPALADA